jgi:hypothetical protein
MSADVRARDEGAPCYVEIQTQRGMTSRLPASSMLATIIAFSHYVQVSLIRPARAMGETWKVRRRAYQLGTTVDPDD